MRRYAPGWLPWVGTLLAVGLVVVWVVSYDADPLAFRLPLVAAVLFLGVLPGWSWYGLDRAGVHRWGPTGHRLVPWDEVEGITARRVARRDRMDSDVFQRVVDARGRTLLRLGPWIGRRRALSRRIREIVAHRREKAGARDA